MRLLCLLLFMFLEHTVPFKVTRNPVVRTKAGAKATLECHVDELPEFCSFIRPDGLELCQPGNADLVSKTCTSEDRSLATVRTESSSCKLNISNVKPYHFGTWTCKSMQWDSWANGTVKVEPYLKGELEITDVWGQVILEADLPQKFSCQLTIDEDPGDVPSDPIYWSISDGSGWKPLSQGVTQKKVGEGEYLSTIVFNPIIADHEKMLSCSSDLTGEDDKMELSVFKFFAENSSVDPVSVSLGQDAHIVYEFTAFPPLLPEKVKWIINQADRQLEPILPGQKTNDGRYMAKNIQFLGNNQHKLVFHIHNVEQVDASASHTLEITIADTKVKTVPFQVILKETSEAPSVVNPADQDNVVTPSDMEESAVTNATLADPIVMREGTSLIIIISIIALCIVLCIAYYSSRQCMDKSEEEKEDEGNITVIVQDKKEEALSLLKNEETTSPEDMKKGADQLLSRLDEVSPTSSSSTEADTQPLLDLQRPRSDLEHKQIGELARLMESFQKDGYLAEDPGRPSEAIPEAADPAGGIDLTASVKIEIEAGRKEPKTKKDDSKASAAPAAITDPNTAAVKAATATPTDTAVKTAQNTAAVKAATATPTDTAVKTTPAVKAAITTTVAPPTSSAPAVTTATAAPAVAAAPSTSSAPAVPKATAAPAVTAAPPTSAAPAVTKATTAPAVQIASSTPAEPASAQNLPKKTASIELMRSKNLVLEPEQPTTPAGLEQKPEPELEIKLSLSPLNLSFDSPTPGQRPSTAAAKDEADGGQKSSSTETDTANLSSPAIVLKTMTRPTPEVRIPIQQQQQQQQPAATARKPPPAPPKSPSPTTGSKDKETPVVRSTVVATPDGSVKRSNSMDAGTQTPRLRPRNFDFDVESSGSEEDEDQLTQKEKLKLEVEKLKQEMQEVKRRISETPPPTPAENGLNHK